MKTIWDQYKIVFIAVACFLALIFIVKAFEQEDKITTKTETKTEIDYKKIVDSIKATIITPKPEIVYVNTIVDSNGNKVNTIVDKKTENTIEAKTYETKVSGLDSSAELQITSLCEPLVISGIINCNEKTVTNTITNTTTKTSAKSGLFVFGQVPINNTLINAEIGLLYQFKNTLGVMGSGQYNNITNSVDFKLGVAIKIF